MTPTAEPSADSCWRTNTTNRTMNIPCATWLAAPIRRAFRRRVEAVIVRRPSIHSATSPPSPAARAALAAAAFASAADLAAAVIVMPATSTATATKVSASTITTAVRPPTATAMPPTGEPTRRAMFWLTALSAFAEASWAGSTRLGTSARVAGPQMLARTASPAATRYTIHSSSADRTARSGSRRTAWSSVPTMMIRRRSTRSTRTPATWPTSTAGTVSTTNTVAVVRAEPVSWNTNTGRPMRSIQSPRSLTRPLSHSRAKLGFRRGEGGRAAAVAAVAVTTSPPPGMPGRRRARARRPTAGRRGSGRCTGGSGRRSPCRARPSRRA